MLQNLTSLSFIIYNFYAIFNKYQYIRIKIKLYVNHFWYLTFEITGVTFFNEGISKDKRNKMTQIIKNIENSNINEDNVSL